VTPSLTWERMTALTATRFFTSADGVTTRGLSAAIFFRKREEARRAAASRLGSSARFWSGNAIDPHRRGASSDEVSMKMALL
jgi:hypothetical protein